MFVNDVCPKYVSMLDNDVWPEYASMFVNDVFAGVCQYA